MSPERDRTEEYRACGIAPHTEVYLRNRDEWIPVQVFDEVYELVSDTQTTDILLGYETRVTKSGEEASVRLYCHLLDMAGYSPSLRQVAEIRDIRNGRPYKSDGIPFGADDRRRCEELWKDFDPVLERFAEHQRQRANAWKQEAGSRATKDKVGSPDEAEVIADWVAVGDLELMKAQIRAKRVEVEVKLETWRRARRAENAKKPKGWHEARRVEEDKMFKSWRKEREARQAAEEKRVDNLLKRCGL